MSDRLDLLLKIQSVASRLDSTRLTALLRFAVAALEQQQGKAVKRSHRQRKPEINHWRI